jgi:hypothetical protein
MVTAGEVSDPAQPVKAVAAVPANPAITVLREIIQLPFFEDSPLHRLWR